MGLAPGSVPEFFGATSENAGILLERRRWLNSAPEKYAALLPEGIPLLEEAIETAAQAGVLRGAPTTTPWERCLELGRAWEPDFLLLHTREDPIRLYGGCVCFPSSWALAEKIGRPLELIHDTVPGLNQQLGNPIRGFLAKLRPGLAWCRRNWGVSRSAELNQHPDRSLPALAPSITLSQAWLRVEHQAFVALPDTEGILFGIRVRLFPLSTVKADPKLASRFVRALRTMPEPVALYKGLSTARERLVELVGS